MSVQVTTQGGGLA